MSSAARLPALVLVTALATSALASVETSGSARTLEIAPGRPALTVVDLSVREPRDGDRVRILVSLALDRPAPADIKVSYGLRHISTTSRDVEAIKAEVTIRKGASSAGAPLLLAGDDASEGFEQAVVSVQPAFGLDVVDPYGTLSISDRVPNLAVSDLVVSEPLPGAVVDVLIPVVAQAPIRKRTTVNYSLSTGGSAESPRIVESRGAIVFESGEAVAHARLRIAGSAAVEGPEKFLFTVEGPSEQATAGVVTVNDLLAVPASSPLPQVEVPPGPADSAASTLALTAAQGEENALAALVTGTALAGFPILDETGASSPSAQEAGLAFSNWELQLLAKKGGVSGPTLADLGQALNAEWRSRGLLQADVPMAELLLNAVEGGTQSDDPTVRFWARFVDAGNPYQPMLGSSETTESSIGAPLTLLQTTFLLRRLAHELTEGLRPEVESTTSALADAAATEAGSAESAALSTTSPPPPCRFSPLEESVVGTAETVIGDGMDNLIQTLRENAVEGGGAALRTWSSILKFAGPLLDITRVALGAFTLQGQYSFNPHPVERPYELAPKVGSPSEVTLTLTRDTSDAEAINCARLAWAAVGLTFQVPTGGPAEGKVDFAGRDGFFTSASDEVLVRFGSNPLDRTLDNGQATTSIEGLGQNRHIDPATADRVLKTARLSACTTLKTPDLVSDSVDIVSDALSGLLSVALGVIERTCWLSFPQDFQVLDWEPEEALTGTIELQYDVNNFHDAVDAGTGYSVTALLSTTHVSMQPMGSEWVDDGRSALTYLFSHQTFNGRGWPLMCASDGQLTDMRESSVDGVWAALDSRTPEADRIFRLVPINADFVALEVTPVLAHSTGFTTLNINDGVCAGTRTVPFDEQVSAVWATPSVQQVTIPGLPVQPHSERLVGRIVRNSDGDVVAYDFGLNFSTPYRVSSFGLVFVGTLSYKVTGILEIP